MASWTLETLQRAVDEVTALVAIYGPDGCDPDAPTDAMVAETDALATAERVLALASSSSDADVAAVAAVAAREVPALGVSVSFLGSRLRGAPVRVDATMPPGYPSKRAPSFDVRAAASASLEEISELRAAGESAMLDARGVEEEEEEEEDGAECVAPALDAIRARIEELDATLRRRAEDRETTTTTTTTTTTSTTSTTVSRRLLWFHHIKAKSKRKDAVAFARELDLGGFSKPGYPGVVVVEGRRENADEYVRRLRALSWLAMSVRAAEDEKGGAGDSADVAPRSPPRRRLPETFRELPENGLGELAACLRDAGLEHLVEATLRQNLTSTATSRRE